MHDPNDRIRGLTPDDLIFDEHIDPQEDITPASTAVLRDPLPGEYSRTLVPGQPVNRRYRRASQAEARRKTRPTNKTTNRK
ncbi:MAG: hypothetical protein H0U59_04180 [Gemmatimonadaceae bacterium]|nr:hypothetical protein [Gemmatimonadaceae bacterium]